MEKWKARFKSIHWPSKKEVFEDTMLTVITTVVLSLLIKGWLVGVDYVINSLISLL